MANNTRSPAFFINNLNNNNNNNMNNTNRYVDITSRGRRSSNSNLNSFSQRPSRLFAITITYVHVTKLHVYYSLEELCFRLLVAEEKHFNLQDVHHHIYMRTKEKYTINEVYEIINRVYDKNHTTCGDIMSNERDKYDDDDNNLGEPIDGVLVQTVRNERTYLKYITKSDIEPMIKSIDHNLLSFSYTTRLWAQNTSKFDYADAYVLNNPQYYKLLEKVHSSVQNSKKIVRQLRLMPYYKPLDQHQCNTWQEEVINWWNDWIVNGFRHKKPQLFLWGGSNTGKTTFVRQLIRLSTGFKSLDNNNNNNNNYTIVSNDRLGNVLIGVQSTNQISLLIDEMAEQFQQSDDSSQSSSSFLSSSPLIRRNLESPLIYNPSISLTQMSTTGLSSTGSVEIEHLNENPNENDEGDEDENEDEDFFENQIFCPTPNEKRFAWQDFDAQLHNLVVIDEFEISEYNVTDLKKVLAGESLVVNRKGECSRKIKLKMPMIIISNLPPPASDVSTQMQGVIQRLKVVRADRLIMS